MTRREYVLRKDGVEVARHSERRFALMDAYKKGLTTTDFAMRVICAPCVTITEEPAKDGGRDG